MIKPDHPSVAALVRGKNVHAEDVRMLQNIIDAALQEHDRFPVNIGDGIWFPADTVEFVVQLYREVGWDIRAHPTPDVLCHVIGVLP